MYYNVYFLIRYSFMYLLWNKYEWGFVPIPRGHFAPDPGIKRRSFVGILLFTFNFLQFLFLTTDHLTIIFCPVFYRDLFLLVVIRGKVGFVYKRFAKNEKSCGFHSSINIFINFNCTLLLKDISYILNNSLRLLKQKPTVFFLNS